ncbi:hypothetical protein BX616_005171 [Lobosporangium transversale]|uniref:Long chronological lifespan protein 2 n=1 Tax=Lobosporangium transversale TaxID=64571 RepID=A0A1Y2GYW4_9FUNG|nr:hypothetical protein BCR41DRAFT_346824 [Lobosporangium transversale]KAF9897677.1 hypothetical protein BX616_005171 [Lobosporangium transversale]ORZ27465.1 hypothetical protein BCR41DRAFT_346824 [Lobosporangium transversale]|eukprot:XP_021885192.1 hypothetical protein BCR41DRAFT_346824 [Lobosporangium transversale]
MSTQKDSQSMTLDSSTTSSHSRVVSRHPHNSSASLTTNTDTRLSHTITKDNDKDKEKDKEKDRSKPTTKNDTASSSSSSSSAYIRVILLSALALLISGYSISLLASSSSSISYFTGLSPIDQLLRSFKPIFDTFSSSGHTNNQPNGKDGGSHSKSNSNSKGDSHVDGRNRQKNASKTKPKTTPFGIPLSELYPPSSPLYTLRKQQSERQEKQKLQQEQRQRRHQKRSRSPFSDFFGTSHEDEEDDDVQGDGDGVDVNDPTWTSNGEACRGYYCGDTNVCVGKPVDCPCPYPNDSKCFRGAWYVCYRGEHPC